MEQENLSPRYRWPGERGLVAGGRTASGGHRERQSTDAGHRDGTARSSEEGPVMGLERRGRADQGHAEANPEGEEPRESPGPGVKPFEIDKRLIYEAWEKVRANKGAPGVDAVSIGLFEERLKDNLYKLWNRMSSGSYFPGPVRGVEIPKDHGEGVRLLGVPNTGDRVAQTAAAMLLEGRLERIFHRDSYGYRPGRSAHDALAACRRRCWKQDWVLDLDVRAFFDSVPHSLLMEAVAHHTSERWVLLYISRWLVAPMKMPDGTIAAREKGTPQGSPISPILANLFMHYAFDTWMDREFPGIPGLPVRALRGRCYRALRHRGPAPPAAGRHRRTARGPGP